MNNSIAITGIGLITPYGLGRRAFWEGIRRGRPAGRRIEGFDQDCRLEEVPEELSRYLSRRPVKYLKRVERIALRAALLAMRDSGLETDRYAAGRRGVSIGSVASCLRGLAEFDTQVNQSGPRHVDPTLVAFGVMSSLTGTISVRLGFQGFHAPFGSGQASALQAFDFACNQLSKGTLDFVLAGGVEELSPQLEEVCRQLSLCAGLDPGRSQPFDRRRTGMVPAEAAALLALERMEEARARGATIYGRIDGFGFSFVGEPYGRRRKEWIRSGLESLSQCLCEGGASAKDADVIFAGANGSRWEDSVEREALECLRPGNAAVTAVKSMLDESLGASAAVQAAAAALSLTHQFIPPTTGFQDSGSPGFNRRIVNRPRAGRLQRAVVNAIGYNGHFGSMLLGAADHR